MGREFSIFLDNISPFVFLLGKERCFLIANRTPKGYNGTKTTGRRISELLPGLLVELGKRAADPREEIFQAWGVAIGEKMAPLTEPLSFLDGVLTVKVKSATLYSLLCQHERPRLLKQLQAKFPVRHLQFRIG